MIDAELQAYAAAQMQRPVEDLVAELDELLADQAATRESRRAELMGRMFG